MSNKKQDIPKKIETISPLVVKQQVDISPLIEDNEVKITNNKFASRREMMGNFLNKRINKEKDDASKI